MIRPEHFSDILRDIGFEPARHFGSIGEGGEWLSIPSQSETHLIV